MRPIVIAAGGTGGHFFPAEALAAELLSRGHRVVLMTDSRSGGLRSPVFEGGESFVLSGAGIAGRGMGRAARAVAALAAGTVQSRTILARLGASAVVGFGGYPSVAPILAAATLRRRPALILHEQNAVLGRANRWLAARADVLALGFADTTAIPAGTTTRVTGNPVRPAIRVLAGIDRPALQPGQLRLLVLGGSLGARVFSDVVPPALAALSPQHRAGLRVAQQCRAEDLARVGQAYQAAGIAHELSPFFPDIAGHLADCDMVVARSGASSVAELAVAGCPAILVPLPSAIDDHQTRNAQASGAVVIAQPDFTSEHLAARIDCILRDPSVLGLMSRACAAQGRVDAAVCLADLVESQLAAKQGRGSASCAAGRSPFAPASIQNETPAGVPLDGGRGLVSNGLPSLALPVIARPETRA